MPCLRQLLSQHPVLLLIDSASARVQVGLWSNGSATKPVWQTSDTEAGTGVFDCVQSLLGQQNRRIADVQAVIFCEGPGSVLGIRTAAVALRTWRVVNPALAAYTYQSLDLVTRSLNREDLSVIADARRDTWHVAKLGAPLRRVSSAELQGEVMMPEHFRHWTALPAHLTRCSYDVAQLFAGLLDADLLRACDEPDAFAHEDPSYVTWTPQVHQAPRSS